MGSIERFRREEPEHGTYLDYGPALRERYGVTEVRLLAVDPEHLYAYWEGGTRLRVRDLTAGTERALEAPEAGTWYLDAEPEHEYEAEIAGVRSNRVRMPRRGPATLVDADWTPTDAELAALRAMTLDRPAYGGSR